jgi:hypothetical protein
MPQMKKGGKWVFGWCVVSSSGEVRIPPAAFDEYSFQIGEPIVYLRGSRRSGGFSIGRKENLAVSSTPLLRRSIGQGIIHEEDRIVIPSETGIHAGQHLLAVRGSRYAVLFLTGGPIYEQAIKHPEIETFTVADASPITW